MNIAVKDKQAAMECPAWAVQVENLRAALELYYMELEKAVNDLTVLLKAYGVDVPAKEIPNAGVGERNGRTVGRMEVR